MSASPLLRAAALAALALPWSVACREQPPRTDVPPGAERTVLVPVSELVPGPAPSGRILRSPYDGDARAIADGERFYTWFNCAGCHGALGGGGIGPPLRDASWIYGGGADQVYLSIVQGRPQGMPAYGSRIPPDVVWRIVAYVHSLGGAPAAAGAGPSPAEAGGGSP